MMTILIMTMTKMEIMQTAQMTEITIKTFFFNFFIFFIFLNFLFFKFHLGVLLLYLYIIIMSGYIPDTYETYESRSTPYFFDSALEKRLDSVRRYDKSVNEWRSRTAHRQSKATKANRQWLAERDRQRSHPYTPDGEVRQWHSQIADYKMQADARAARDARYSATGDTKKRRRGNSPEHYADSKRQKTTAGGRRMKYKSTRRRVKTHRRRHRKH
jgi:hypothetical protein